MIQLDGAMGEGGGQILRTALSLSLISGRPFRLEHIRTKRKRPGLMPQHLQAVNAAATIGHARVSGAHRDSMTLEFRPGAVAAGDYRFDIGTAGAAALVLQTLYLPLALASGVSSVTVSGGTHVPFSPCFHYLDLMWRPAVARAGICVELALGRCGFYPPGGGVLHATIQPAPEILPVALIQRGASRRILVLSGVAGLPNHVMQRQAERAQRRLATQQPIPVRVQQIHLDAPSKGTLLLVLAEFEHTRACFFALGQRGKRAEQVADEAVDELLAFLATDAAVDPYLCDQLMLPLALANGNSVLHTSRLTQHQLTNAKVIRRFLPVRFDFEGRVDQPGTVRVLVHN